ncbi:MAG: hypothetical protein K0R83_168 [Caulobacter sp.]|jgi:hypothetical protein|nr:hypothetical protein [Caulobacter sp.]
MDPRSFPVSAAVSSAGLAGGLGRPLLAAWAGAYGGLPPFDKVALPDFEPAFKAAMDIQRAELKAITDTGAAESRRRPPSPVATRRRRTSSPSAPAATPPPPRRRCSR